jgi:hypothetical protein
MKKTNKYLIQQKIIMKIIFIRKKVIIIRVKHIQ